MDVLAVHKDSYAPRHWTSVLHRAKASRLEGWPLPRVRRRSRLFCHLILPQDRHPDPQLLVEHGLHLDERPGGSRAEEDADEWRLTGCCIAAS
jgi:hypothetical protein